MLGPQATGGSRKLTGSEMLASRADGRRLRIVHCFRSPVGGIFRHVRDLATAQAAAGHLVGIVCDSTTGGELEEQFFQSLKPVLALGIARTPMQRHVGPGDMTSAWSSYKIIKELKPDVLHGHGAKGGVYARMFGSLLRVYRYRVARVYTAHGGSLHYDEGTMTGKLFFSLERMMERFTDHLLFVSDFERQAFRRKVGEPRPPTSLVYNGLNDSDFAAVTCDPDAVDLLYIGMMRDLKGPDLFIDALAQAEMQLGREMTAVMVGDGEDLPRYETQAARLGLQKRVRFMGSMPARQAFKLAHTVVVPSRAEAMPYIVLEALAAGKPMIATNVGGIPEILGAGSPALVQPDSGELASKMCEAIGDPGAYSQFMPDLGDLRQRFGVSVMAAQIETAYFCALA